MQIFHRAIGDAADDLDDNFETGLRRRLRLLMVDENPTARTVMARRLSHLDYDVSLAENGVAAISMLAGRPFDVILIDMGMTMMSGIETMKRIRSTGIAPGSSVVMITSRSDSLSLVEALRAGADDHVAKPLDFDALDARLRHASARARRIGALSRRNLELDARVARRAMELGETRDALEQLQSDRARLVASIQALHDEVERLSARD